MARELPQILQLDQSGDPRRWMTYEDAAYYKAKNLIAWTAGGQEFTIHGGENALTGRQSTMDLSTIIAVKGLPRLASLSRTPSLTNRTLFRRDQHICAYCGGEFGTAELTRDHVIPTSRGGLNVWTNVVAACSGCNKLKTTIRLRKLT